MYVHEKDVHFQDLLKKPGFIDVNQTVAFTTKAATYIKYCIFRVILSVPKI